MAKMASAVTESGIWETITGCDAPPPTYDPQMMSIAGSSVGIEAFARSKSGLINSITTELRDLVSEGLGAKTEDEWHGFWTRARFLAFERLIAALSSAIDSAYSSDAERRAVIERGNAACISKIAARLGHLVPVKDLDAAEERIRQACDLVEGFRTLPDPRVRGVDADCAVRLAFASVWYSIAANSLTVAAEQSEPSPLVPLLVRLAKGTSVIALRTAQHGSDLRAVAPDEHLILNASIGVASDGFGFVGALSELGLETCSETEREMRRLLVEAVRGYFRAEKKRGGLQSVLSMLQVNENASQLLVSLYVKEKGEPQLADMLKVAL